MKERPILFSAPMVRAILAGAKTQTRRLVKLPSDVEPSGVVVDPGGTALYGPGPYIKAYPAGGDAVMHPRIRCPYGYPGDRLWVKEGYALSKRWDRNAPATVPTVERDIPVWYRADVDVDVDEESWINRGRWRSSLHMPRWVSRITLEVTEVRVERLQDITEEDARAEGVTTFPRDPEGDCWTDGTHRAAFEYLWGQINGFESWLANPWVWVVSFRRLE